MGRNRLNYFTICANFRRIKQGGILTKVSLCENIRCILSLKPILICRRVPKYSEKTCKNSIKITVFLRTFWQKYNPNCLAILCHQSDICTTEKERRVHIMKNEIRFTLESKQRPKLAQEIGNIL